MRFSKILNFGRVNKVALFLAQNKEWLFLSAVLCFGSVWGILKFSDSDFLQNFSKWYFSDYYSLRNSGAFFKIFFKSILNFSLPIILAFVFSTTPMGSAILPALLFFFGYFSGSLTAYLYSEYALKGIAFNAVMIFPVIFPFIVILLASAHWGFKYSIYSFKNLISKSTSADLSSNFKELISKHLILLSFIPLVSLIDSFLSTRLLDKFI